MLGQWPLDVTRHCQTGMLSFFHDQGGEYVTSDSCQPL